MFRCLHDRSRVRHLQYILLKLNGTQMLDQFSVPVVFLRRESVCNQQMSLWFSFQR
uniref:Uncharacterized protein n=1 Tax=Anguilla anguilla TaxID=7936 RepID=A0A0E9WTY4_ANGAN